MERPTLASYARTTGTDRNVSIFEATDRRRLTRPPTPAGERETACSMRHTVGQQHIGSTLTHAAPILGESWVLARLPLSPQAAAATDRSTAAPARIARRYDAQYRPSTKPKT